MAKGIMYIDGQRVPFDGEKNVLAVIRKAGIDMPTFCYYSELSVYGACRLCVVEAVARRVVEDKSKNTLQAIQFSGIRGSETIRAVTLPVGDRALRIAVVHGLVNAQKLLDDIESGQEYFDLVEVMTCKTGCVGGAGQPYGLIPVKQQRAEGLYEADRTALIKRSERNPIVTKLLEGALKGRTHQLLHVEYKRPDKA